MYVVVVFQNLWFVMDWFGLTLYGFADPIKDMMRPDYKEPENPPDLLEIVAKGDSKKPFYELVKTIDCYTGIADGYSYKSCARLRRSRKKHIYKPVGPEDQYLYPGANSMHIGWWKIDPALEGSTWFLPRRRHALPSSDIGRYVDEVLKMDKFFKM